MSKYIVKNCTSLDSDGTTCQDCSYEDCGADDCINRTDCVLKQIVELCEQYKKDFSTTNGVWLLANNITNLLDIQEVE